MTRNPIDREPVLGQLAAGAIVWAAARYGLKIDQAQALEIAGAAYALLSLFTRQLVTPTAKLPTEPPPIPPLPSSPGPSKVGQVFDQTRVESPQHRPEGR